MKNNMIKRLLSIVICLSMLVAYLPGAAQAAVTGNDTRVADPSTMDGWKEFFLPDPMMTENAGGVWTDKSVFTDDLAFDGTGIIQDRDDSFLVALSAIASSMSVTGMSNQPTDTMMILDLSSSMYLGSQRDPSTIRTMLAAVNSSITKLQSLNEHNRVGVTVYFGGPDRNQSDNTNSMVLLPLDRYTHSNGAYLKANVTGGRLISVAVNSGVKNSANKTVAQTKRTVTDVAGTYAQLGILDAMNQFLAADTVVPATTDYQVDVTRVPVFIFMSDGEPTAATHQYTKKVNAGMGNNTISIRSANETDFVTQLTAAYAREMVDAHYADAEPLFYSLSLGTSVSLAVMDPANHMTTTIDKYWNDLLDDGSARITVYNSPNAWGDPTVKKTYTVSTTTAAGATFPATKLQRNYVDKHFTAANASSLTDAFENIVNQINLVSHYTPTLVDQNDDLSGYISFVDKVGKYMSVTDIKGILINNTLFSGAELSKNFVTGGGDLGTYEDPKPLGDEMVHAVQIRLGIEDVAEALALVGLAYQYGQLSYTSPTEYSNYIGWYANAAGEYVGFWHEGIQTMPIASGDPANDPVYIVKSYGYLGEVDETQGVAASDMMYATVQVRTEIATGEETVVFAVPAALIPLVTYQVELDQEGGVSNFTVSGAKHPIRLVYEVALDESIDPYTLTETVSADYLAANTNADGSVNFYTNQYEADNTTGYGKVNTYSYFNPSRQNSKYYYTEDTLVYTDTNGTLYTGEAKPQGTFYRAYTVYEEDRIHIHYRQISHEVLAVAHREDNGFWYIGKGNVNVNLDGYTINKSDNATGTLTYANQPFVDHHNHSVDDLGYNFIVGATLGNNGRITVIPNTGIALSKTMAPGVEAPVEAFDFVITGPTDGAVDALLVDADGIESKTTATFSGGKASVSLKAGQKLYISDLAAGKTYTVEEIPTVDYVPDQNSVTVTLTAGQMSPVAFVNADRGTGSLTVAKEIHHSLGAGYTIPAGKSFTIQVDLDGVGVENAEFAAAHTNGTVTTITTDEQGRFLTTLRHDEQLQLYGLPAGTVATVTEPDPGKGFTASYWEEGVAGDGIVTVPKGGIASVTVLNDYAPDGAPVNVVLKGVKNFITAAADWNGAQFRFQLQKWNGTGWETIATETANEADPAFDFSAVMQAQSFTAPGTYNYQVMETNGGSTIGGITYDATLHTFGVVVSDVDMDGTLEIDGVISYHSGKEFAVNADGDWEINVSFTNEYEATGCNLFLDVQKALINLSNSPLVDLSGYQFGLYENGVLVASSEFTDGVGEARLILHYELADEGKHTYILKEIVPDNGIDGMTYSSEEYTVEILVTDNGDGTTSASIVSIDGKTDYETPVFTNVYQPKIAELEIDFVSKHMTGRDMEPEEFDFELRLDGVAVLTGTNAYRGTESAVTFNDKLRFNSVGTWAYELVETSQDGSGVTTDKTVFNILITVTDVGGRLSASYQVLNVVGDQVVFENAYKPEIDTYTLAGTKVLEGRPLLNEEFVFLLQEVDAHGQPIEDGLTMETSNHIDGSFEFGTIVYTETGIHYYQLSEKTGELDGVDYDETVYLVTVAVTDEGKGQLDASGVITTLPNGESAESVVFTNHYAPGSTKVQFTGEKVLENKTLKEGEFSFELYVSDENWAQGDLLQSVSNKADRSFAFEEITYETVGVRYYLIREKDGGTTVDGVVHDATVYRVKVQINDNLQGQLRPTVQIVDDMGTERGTLVFVNTYTITDPAEVTFEGTKTLNGRDLVEGEFSFELYGADDSFAAVGEAVQTVTNAADGSIRFETLSFGEAGTYRYLIREQEGDLENVTYDASVYQITVTVADLDGLGVLDVESIDIARVTADGTEVADAITFVNSYEVPNDPNDPTDPTDPTDPSDPTDPEKPTDPSDPTDPEKPTDPSDPTDPEKPTDPGDPTDPEPPKTGDISLPLWMAMLAVSCGGVITLLNVKKDEKAE